MVNRHFALAGIPLPAGFGDAADVAVVSGSGLARSPCRPLQPSKGPALLLLERTAVEAEATIVVFAAASHAVFRLPAQPRLPLLDWLRSRRQVAAQMRAYLSRAFTEMPDEDGSGAALLRELDLFSPPSARNLLARNIPVNAAVELLVADGAGGIFIRGWLRDPHQLVTGAELQIGGSEPQPLDATWLRFPRPDIDRLYKARAAAFGFVAHLADLPEAKGQAVLRLHLGSGGSIDLTARFTAGHPSELRDAVLGGVPPERLTTEAIARIVAPAAVPLHRQHLARRLPPEIVQLGDPVPDPRFSVIVPLYRNLDYLRFQLGAFATDPAMRRAELIFVLDSPEQRADLVHFLSGLNQLYGLPMSIAVMSENFGYAAANNAGAALARGDILIMLNSDVVPEAPGWMRRLAAPLRRREVVATGARLLFDDQSLQHAGMRFARDAGGHWLNLHYHKGAPRDFAPALKARKVPAVTGAALLVRRDAFLAVGGFTEDYIIGDYEDSDLCLKLRRAGGEIRYCPDAVLYHFERKSINRHAGYQRSVAGLYNRWLAA
ncbi:MAG: glycosyltransferase family 2 protein, partial [Oceanibaculum sp.]